MTYCYPETRSFVLKKAKLVEAPIQEEFIVSL